jgi:membrane-bound metal-dependent hydrolase YbcI (DUF457 family)
MKLLTHVVFGAGSAFAFLSSILDGGAIGAVTVGIAAIALSVSVNYVIDELGHSRGDGLSVRSPLTHSVFTAPMWGGSVAYVVWLATSRAAGLEVPLVAAGGVVALVHLLLDSMTEGGVFYTTGRVALAHFGNDNAVLNWAFVVLGALMLLI